VKNEAPSASHGPPAVKHQASAVKYQGSAVKHQGSAVRLKAPFSDLNASAAKLQASGKTVLVSGTGRRRFYHHHHRRHYLPTRNDGCSRKPDPQSPKMSKTISRELFPDHVLHLLIRLLLGFHQVFNLVLLSDLAFETRLEEVFRFW
jgi:hypothetical protein